MPTLIDRLRAGADNIHSIGPVRAADLMREAADALAVPPSGRRPTRPSGSLDELKHQDAVAAHIKAHGGDPAAATVAQIADAMNAVDPNATYKPNAEGNGLDWSPIQRAGVGGSIRIVAGDPKTIAALRLVGRGCHEHCLAEPRCRNRAEMRAAHGTPAEYIAAISRAAPELTVAEADLAVARYCEAWNAAPGPDAALQRSLNSTLAAMGCDPASATRAEFKQALWSASKHVEMDSMLAAVAGELEAGCADDPDLSTPIGAPSLAVAEQFDAEAHAAAEDPGGLGDIDAVELDMLPMPEQLAEHRRRGEATASVNLWPGSGLPPLMSATTKARIEQWMKRRVDPEPRGESYTPEQEAEAAEQAERFQGLDDSDRE